jgi:hypothetical protein
MRPTKEQVKERERFFTFTGDQKDLQKQVEFLSAYFIAKLQILRRSNDYITREQAAEELFYKDMIAACACFIQVKKHENTNKQGKSIS